MPNYVHYFKTDWSYGSLAPGQHAIARRYEALFRSDPGVTAQWLADKLTAASRELPGVTLRAFGEDDDGEWALVARDGAHWDDPDDPFDADAADITAMLELDDYRAAGVERIWTMLFFPEPLLAQVVAKARELDTSASWVLQRAWQLAGSRIDGVRLGELVEARRVRESLFLQTEQWAELKARAARDDTSMSSLVQRALIVALPELRR